MQDMAETLEKVGQAVGVCPFATEVSILEWLSLPSYTLTMWVFNAALLQLLCFSDISHCPV